MPNSVAIVTGASQGIGKATALRLARDFPSLVLIARDEAHLQETAQQAKTFGAESLVIPLDLREPAAAEKIVNGTLQRFGRIDALVNIAGAVPQIDLFEMTDAQWDDGMALKFHGARRLTIKSLGRVEGFQRLRCAALGPGRMGSQARICGGGCDQCGDYRARESLRRARNQGWGAGE